MLQNREYFCTIYLRFRSPVALDLLSNSNALATLTSHRADAEGCISNPNHCAESGEGGCCVNYYIPFCGDPQRYGAAAPAGSIKCMADVPVPLSAAPPSDLELSLVAEAFDSKCYEIYPASTLSVTHIFSHRST